jgi:hypothetical protein
MFKFFKSRPLPTVEQWATSNANKASADDLIAGAIIQSFAKDYSKWQFVGKFEQKGLSRDHHFVSTSLSRKIPGKKHIEIAFLFKQTSYDSDGYTHHNYKVCGCEVNGIRLEDKAFKAIYKNWVNIGVKVRAAEEQAMRSEAAMKENETKWNLAEDLLGYKRNGTGLLVPKKQAEEKPSIIEDMEMPL